MKGKLLDPQRSTDTRNVWNHDTLTVRVMAFQIPDFRPTRLVTNVLEPCITAKAFGLYNSLRELMLQAADQTHKDLLALSFLDCLQIIINAVPQMSKPMAPTVRAKLQQY